MSFFSEFLQWSRIAIILLFILIVVKVYLNRKRAGAILLKIKTKTYHLGIAFIAVACFLAISTIYIIFRPTNGSPVTVRDIDAVIFCITFGYYYFYDTRICVNGIIYNNELIPWERIESWSWLSNFPDKLEISFLWGRKYKEITNTKWRFPPRQKEDIDRILKEHIP